MMNCFSCFAGAKEKKDELEEETSTAREVEEGETSTARAQDQATSNQERLSERLQPTADDRKPADKIYTKSFTFIELLDATRAFHDENFLGEGNFGRVYKGTMGNEIVAVKQLNSKGSQDNEEFRMEVLVLTLHSHPNLVQLIGYCCDGNQKLLVYEYMCKDSLDRHLFNIPADREPLNWFWRMKIALDVAQGLKYLHAESNPPIVYGDLNCSNILLGEEYNAKISDLGQAKFGVRRDNSAVSSRVYRCNAPEYLRTQEFTIGSDIYSFGVFMLELISGRKAVNNTDSPYGQVLVIWAKSLFKDKRRYKDLLDPRLVGRYPEEGLNQAVSIAWMCLQDEPKCRPTITDVIPALSNLTIPRYEQKKPVIPDKSKSKEPLHDIGTVVKARDRSGSSSNVHMAKDKDTLHEV